MRKFAAGAIDLGIGSESGYELEFDYENDETS